MVVYVIQNEGAEPEDDPEDIGVLIEGVEVLGGLGDTAIACALLFGLIYCLNLSYPPELKCTFLSPAEDSVEVGWAEVVV